MVEKVFRPGEIIFNEGDNSDYVVQIVSGDIEIIKQVDGKAIVLGNAGAGEIVGEMGIFEGRPRNATARAKGILTVHLLGEKDFMKMVGDTPKLAKHLLHRLSARLRSTSNQLVMAKAAGGDAKAKQFLDSLDLDNVTGAQEEDAKPVLSANNEMMSEQLPAAGVLIDQFPFIIGREPEGFDHRKTKTTEVHLQLTDYPPYRLSRVHFMILPAHEVFVLRDLGSSLGTGVNGQFLGVHFARDSMKLEEGDNEIIAGGNDSPFSFKLHIPKT